MVKLSTRGAAKRRNPVTPPAFSTARKPFLSTLRVDHGPSDILGRFFIAADRAFAEQGVALAFTGFDDLEQANAANRDSWKPLNPTFVPTNGLVGDADSFAVLGLNGSDVVSSVAAKLFRWHGSDLTAEASSLRFLYNDPTEMAPATASCAVTSPSACKITGRVAYAGAAWLHPILRKRNLASIQARLVRALCYARWGMHLTFGITSVGLIGTGHSERNGWRHIEPGVTFGGLESCPAEAGLVWMTSDETIEDLSLFLNEASAGRRYPIELGRTQDAPATGDLERQEKTRITNRHTSS